MKCPRCDRGHSGVCGIPAGVSLGFGARVGGIGRNARQGQFSVAGKPKAKRLSTAFLERGLTEAKEHYQKVLNLLKVVPKDMLKEEYDMLSDSESKLNYLIKQLGQQILVREER